MYIKMGDIMGVVKTRNTKFKGTFRKLKPGKNVIRTLIIDKSGRKRIIPIRKE